jgi:2-methylaconitate cis-trans-isomerase PrpF
VSEQKRIRTVIMRGGSSKALFLRAEDLPEDEAARTRLLLALFGSPDKRQIDGLGGSDYLTSKCAIMSAPSRDDADIDYAFAQVSVENPIVSYDINCGNISAAAAVYAIEEGYVPAAPPQTTVRVHNTNTGKVLRMIVPVKDGAPLTEGDFAIDGVPGTGAEIRMDFSATSGGATGRLLPTGNVRDRVHVPSLGRDVEVSIVDIANTCVFVRATDLGLTGTELPQTMPGAAVDALEEIRVASAKIAGIESYLLPFQVIVGPPQSYPDFLHGRTVKEEDTDLVARLFVEKIMHKAYAGTGATCLAVAARIEGSVVNEVARRRNTSQVRIGHPSGTLPIVAEVAHNGAGWEVKEVFFSRTARRLMEGTAFLRAARL